MTEHIDLDELLLMIAEASYNGKITADVTYISTKVLETSKDDLDD